MGSLQPLGNSAAATGRPSPGAELREVMTDSNADLYYVGTEVAQVVTTGRRTSTRPGHPASR